VTSTVGFVVNIVGFVNIIADLGGNVAVIISIIVAVFVVNIVVGYVNIIADLGDNVAVVIVVTIVVFVVVFVVSIFVDFVTIRRPV